MGWGKVEVSRASAGTRRLSVRRDHSVSSVVAVGSLKSNLATSMARHVGSVEHSGNLHQPTQSGIVTRDY